MNQKTEKICIEDKVFVNSNNVCIFGSNNWRADWHQFKGSSYATLVKKGKQIPIGHNSHYPQKFRWIIRLMQKVLKEVLK